MPRKLTVRIPSLEIVPPTVPDASPTVIVPEKEPLKLVLEIVKEPAPETDATSGIEAEKAEDPLKEKLPSDSAKPENLTMANPRLTLAALFAGSVMRRTPEVRRAMVKVAWAS